MHKIQFQLRPRLAKDGTKEAIVPRGKLPRVAEVLALALGFDDMIRRGLAKDYSDLARLGCISKERISQIMRLLWLAPDIQQEILTLPRTPRGLFPVGEVALRQVASKMLWAEQRAVWARLTDAATAEIAALFDSLNPSGRNWSITNNCQAVIRRVPVHQAEEVAEKLLEIANHGRVEADRGRLAMNALTPTGD
jgi:hypothetical protein